MHTHTRTNKSGPYKDTRNIKTYRSQPLYKINNWTNKEHLRQRSNIKVAFSYFKGGKLGDRKMPHGGRERGIRNKRHFDVERRIKQYKWETEIELESKPEYSYSQQKAISLHTAREKPGTPPQPRVTAPLILLTLLVFHPHRLAGSIHTSITLQSCCFPLPYKGSGEQWRVQGWLDKQEPRQSRSPCLRCGL